MDFFFNPKTCCLKETHSRFKDTHRLKAKGRKKIFYANSNQKRAGMIIIISHKIDVKIKTVTRDKEGHYMMIKKVNSPGRYNSYKYTVDP